VPFRALSATRAQGQAGLRHFLTVDGMVNKVCPVEECGLLTRQLPVVLHGVLPNSKVHGHVLERLRHIGRQSPHDAPLSDFRIF